MGTTRTGSPAALALPSHYSVSQLYHSQWTIREGALVAQADPLELCFARQAAVDYLRVLASIGMTLEQQLIISARAHGHA